MMESFPSLSWRYCDEVGHTRFYIYQLSANGKPPFLSTPISFAVGLVNMIDYGVSGTVGQRVPPEYWATIADLTQIFQGPCKLKLSIGAIPSGFYVLNATRS